MGARVEWHGAEVTRLVDECLAQGLEEAGSVVETAAAADCPVDTGTLRDSITSSTDGLHLVVGSDVEYAVFVEVGTRRTPAQPFLRPALYESDLGPCWEARLP